MATEDYVVGAIGEIRRIIGDSAAGKEATCGRALDPEFQGARGLGIGIAEKGRKTNQGTHHESFNG